MATGIAGRWQKAARLLQHCCDQRPGTAEAAAACLDAHQLFAQLQQQPTPPKAAWKKLVQQHKVPLQLGTAFSTAAQRSWESPATLEALHALGTLLDKAAAADLIKQGMRAANLSSGIPQQLQQAGLLQQLVAVMTALAAGLQAEAAAIAARGWDVAGGSMECFAATHDLLALYCRLVCIYPQLTTLWWPSAQANPSTSLTWLCDPSGHAAAMLQLLHAAHRYTGSLLRHALPTARDRAPQRAQGLLSTLQASSAFGHALCISMLHPLSQALQQPRQQLSDAQAAVMKQLALSPDLLPCAVAALLMSSSGGKSAHLTGNSSTRTSGSSNRAATDAPSACHLQLLELLGLHPLMLAWADWPVTPANPTSARDCLGIAAEACRDCFKTELGRLLGASARKSPEQQQQQQEQQRWQFEQQVWLLLPAALLPRVSTLLSSHTQQAGTRGQQEEDLTAAWQLLAVCRLAWTLVPQLSVCRGRLGIPSTPPPAAVVQELLGAVLQLTQAKHLAPAAAAAATTVEATPGPAANALGASSSTHRGSTSPSSSRTAGANSAAVMRAECHGSLLLLLVTGLSLSSECSQPGMSQPGGSSSLSSTSPAAAVAATVPPAADRLVEVCAAVESQLRAVVAAVQGGAVSESQAAEQVGGVAGVVCGSNDPGAVLARHMGLCGPEAFARELRQYYSLLSSVLRLSCCHGEQGQPCLGHEEAGSCCWATGKAALELLEWVAAADAAAAAAGGTDWNAQQAAAAAQQPAVDYLPSLVIFGRCCLSWAQQLQQQRAPVMGLLAPWRIQLLDERPALTQALQQARSTASVCIPALRQGESNEHEATSGGLESLVATALKWVTGPKSAAAHAQLAAAGCGQQQLQQQLDALLAAQQAVQPVSQQQGMGAAYLSINTLVQQLQATGAMLSSIAVPHFCNHAACTNLSGPTEVGLVSGRSCLCGGCRVARYCGRRCQRLAWAQHKPVCKALQAAAAAGAAAAVAPADAGV